MSPLNERQRMQYLEAMGVETFVPRWVLPVARASVQCRLPVAAGGHKQANAAQVHATVATAEAFAKPARALVDALLERESSLGGDPPEDKAASPTPASNPVEAASQDDMSREIAAFSLAFWRVHPQVMVVDSRQPAVLPTEALLRALLAGLGLARSLPRAEIQVWPMAGSGDRSWAAAREMMHAFLESRLLSQPVSYLLVMGGDAAKAILGDTAEASAGCIRLDSFACEALVTPSLSELLLQPHLKAPLWNLLKPLRLLADDAN